MYSANNLSKNYKLYIESYKLGKDILKSIFVHLIIFGNIFIFSFFQYRAMLFSSSRLSVYPQFEVSNTDPLPGNQPTAYPVKASLIEHNLVEQAIKRQELQAHEKINREKNLQQKEQQIANLKKITEKEAGKLKEEVEKIKKQKQQLQAEQAILQKSTKTLKQQAQTLSLEQKKLQQQAQLLNLEKEKLKEQGKLISSSNNELLEKKNSKKNDIITMAETLLDSAEDHIQTQEFGKLHKGVDINDNLQYQVNPTTNNNAFESTIHHPVRDSNNNVNTLHSIPSHPIEDITNDSNILGSTTNHAVSRKTNHNSITNNLGWAQHEINNYYSKWKHAIIDNRKKMMFFKHNMTCAVKIKLLSNGHLAAVKLEQSSGNLLYDKFSEQAIYKSAPFEMPQDPILNQELVNTEHIIHFDADSLNE